MVVTLPDPPIDPGPNIPIGPIDNRCPRCGLVTCNGNCITRYEIKDLPPGPIISGGEGTHGSISPGGVPETVLTNPLQSMNEYVAVFHTHTPLTYWEGEGGRYPIGPSPADTEWAWTKNEK